MNENRVKSERTFEIPCRESLFNIIAERRLKSLSPFLTQENEQSKKLERKNQMSSKNKILTHLFLIRSKSLNDYDDDPATRRPSPPENEGDNGTVAAERTVRPKSGEPVKKRVSFETSNSSTAGTTLPDEADFPSASKHEHNSCNDISANDVNAATSAIWLKTTIRNKINEGENSVAAIDTNERRHAHELNFISPHPSLTSQANSNGQTLTNANNEPQHKQRKMKRMPQPTQLKSLSLFYQRLRTRWLFDRRRSIKLMCVMCESSCELVAHVSHHITNL
jgi:hypothetical protein